MGTRRTNLPRTTHRIEPGPRRLLPLVHVWSEQPCSLTCALAQASQRRHRDPRVHEPSGWDAEEIEAVGRGGREGCYPQSLGVVGGSIGWLEGHVGVLLHDNHGVARLAQVAEKSGDGRSFGTDDLGEGTAEHTLQTPDPAPGSARR